MLHCGSCSGVKSCAACSFSYNSGPGRTSRRPGRRTAAGRTATNAPQSEGRRPLGAFDGRQAAVVFGQPGGGRIEQVGRILAEGLELWARCPGRRRTRTGRARTASCASHTTLSAVVQPVPPGGDAEGSGSAAAVGRIDVQPHLVAPADVGDFRQRVERADRRGARQAATDKDGSVLAAAAGSTSSSSRLGSIRRRASSPTRSTCSVPSPSMPAAASHAVVGVRVDDQHRAAARPGDALFPAVAQHHVAGGEQGRQIGQRTAVRDQAGELAGRPTDLRPERSTMAHSTAVAQGPMS